MTDQGNETSRPEASLGGRRGLGRLTPVLLWAVGMWAAFYPMLGSGFRQSQRDLGDSRIVNYILEHTFRWVGRWPGHERLWEMPFYHPQPNTGGLSDILLGIAPLYWPWRVLGAAPDTAFQLFILTASALNFWVCYLVLRRSVDLPRMSAGLGAYVFAFASSRVAQFTHQQLVAQLLVPLVLIALLAIFSPTSSPRRRRIGWAGLFGVVVLQFWAGYYWGWFLGFVLGLAFVVALTEARARAALRWVGRQDLAWILGCLVVTAALLLPMALRYLAAAESVGVHDFAADVAPRMPRLQSWVFMGTSNLVYAGVMDLPFFRALPIPVEQQLGIGLLTAFMALWGLIHARRTPMGRLLLLATVALAGLVTLYPFGLTPWRVVYEVVPGAQAIRAPARAGVFLLFPLSIGVAVAVAGIEREGKTLVAAALVALCVAEQLRFVPSYDKLEARHFVERIAQRVPEGCEAFYFAVIPPEEAAGSLPHRPWKYHLDAMWAGLHARVPAVNGYSGFLPTGWLPLYDNVLRGPDDEDRLDGALAAWMGQHDAGSACRVDVGLE